MKAFDFSRNHDRFFSSFLIYEAFLIYSRNVVFSLCQEHFFQHISFSLATPLSKSKNYKFKAIKKRIKNKKRIKVKLKEQPYR